MTAAENVKLKQMLMLMLDRQRLVDMSYCVNDGTDVAEVMSRIVRYLSGASHLVPLPLAEVILTNKDRG